MAGEASYYEELQDLSIDLIREYGRNRINPPPPAPVPVPPSSLPVNTPAPGARTASASAIGAQLLDILQSPRFWLVVGVFVGGFFLLKKMKR